MSNCVIGWSVSKPLINLTRRACDILQLVVVATVLVLLFCWPDLPEVTLTSLTVTKFNFTGDHISGYLNIQFQAINPNLGTDFSYHEVYCSVYHTKHRLASTVFSGFVQKEKETTPINVTVHLTHGTTARGIGNDLATLIKWRAWWSEYVTFSCDDVAVGGLLPANGGHGKMIGPARKCYKRTKHKPNKWVLS